MTLRCRNGHPRTEENTGTRTDGGKFCRLCRNARNAIDRERWKSKPKPGGWKRQLRHMGNGMEPCPEGCLACHREQAEIERLAIVNGHVLKDSHGNLAKIARSRAHSAGGGPSPQDSQLGTKEP